MAGPQDHNAVRPGPSLARFRRRPPRWRPGRLAEPIGADPYELVERKVASVDLMGEIDSWPQPWRLICHEIGYRGTVELMQAGYDPQMAADWAELGLEPEEWEDAGEDPDPVLGNRGG